MEPFSSDKLFLSLYESCKHRPSAIEDARALTETLRNNLANHVNDGVIDTEALKQDVQTMLQRFDQAASIHYAAFHK